MTNLFGRLFLIILFLLCAQSAARAQQPFITDDADVTDKGKVHLQVADEYDLLQRTLYPGKTQNTTNVEVDYGLWQGVEVGFAPPLLALHSSRVVSPQTVFGLGDSTLHLKYNFYKEREGSRLPALAVSAIAQFPTGDASRRLGTGLTDYYFNGILQKSVTDRTKLRLNGGILFAGNTVNGLLGIRTRGRVFTSGGSLVKQFTKKFDFGAELTGAVTGNFQLSKGQLQALAGGNYAIRKNFTLDFGLTAGRFSASPRLGAQLGFSKDF
ncbi:MAG: transporter [Acidobacteriota bacterium]|nr:transporter [Acidobacteriota bacterium]